MVHCWGGVIKEGGLSGCLVKPKMLHSPTLLHSRKNTRKNVTIINSFFVKKVVLLAKWR